VKEMDNMFQSATSFKQGLCGRSWVYTKASKREMFTYSPGRISRTVCVGGGGPGERELIMRTTKKVISSSKCAKCGKFKRSGKVSCCAPGGAWFKNCGGAGNARVDHNWSEGIDACKKEESTPKIMGTSVCPKCGTVGKSRRSSCCGRGGSWFRDCGSAGNKKRGHTWSAGIRACKTRGKKVAWSKKAVGEKKC